MTKKEGRVKKPIRPKSKSMEGLLTLNYFIVVVCKVCSKNNSPLKNNNYVDYACLI